MPKGIESSRCPRRRILSSPRLTQYAFLAVGGRPTLGLLAFHDWAIDKTLNCARDAADKVLRNTAAIRFIRSGKESVNEYAPEPLFR